MLPERLPERLLTFEANAEGQLSFTLPIGRNQFWLIPPESGKLRGLQGRWEIPESSSGGFEALNRRETRDDGGSLRDQGALSERGYADAQDRGADLPLDQSIRPNEAALSGPLERRLSLALAVRVEGSISDPVARPVRARIHAEQLRWGWATEGPTLPLLEQWAESDERGEFEPI